VETIACLNNLSHTLLLQGRPEDAEKLLQKGIDVMLGSHGERHIRHGSLAASSNPILSRENRFGELRNWARSPGPAPRPCCQKVMRILAGRSPCSARSWSSAAARRGGTAVAEASSYSAELPHINV